MSGVAVTNYKEHSVVLDGEHCLLAQQYSGMSVSIKFPVSFSSKFDHESHFSLGFTHAFRNHFRPSLFPLFSCP